MDSTLLFPDLPADHPLNTGVGLISVSNLEPICKDDASPLSLVRLDRLACEFNFECPPFAHKTLTGESLSKREKRIVRRWHVRHKAYQVRRFNIFVRTAKKLTTHP